MFGYACRGHAQQTRPDIRGATREGKIKGNIEEIEKRAGKVALIEKIMDENGKNSKLLWSNPYLSENHMRHEENT